jgi:hypothetical protein
MDNFFSIFWSTCPRETLNGHFTVVEIGETFIQTIHRETLEKEAL